MPASYKNHHFRVKQPLLCTSSAHRDALALAVYYMWIEATPLTNTLAEIDPLQYRYFTEVCTIRAVRHKVFTSPEELYA
jgi:hypothetical protein